nr:MAG TPA: hypothetical protein [Caudoviricetes sp.]
MMTYWNNLQELTLEELAATTYAQGLGFKILNTIKYTPEDTLEAFDKYCNPIHMGEILEENDRVSCLKLAPRYLKKLQEQELKAYPNVMFLNMLYKQLTYSYNISVFRHNLINTPIDTFEHFLEYIIHLDEIPDEDIEPYEKFIRQYETFFNTVIDLFIYIDDLLFDGQFYVETSDQQEYLNIGIGNFNHQDQPSEDVN